MLVKKADGSMQLFDREKIVRTCLRMGANRQVANEVADKIERRLYNGMSTRTILSMIFRFMRKYRPAVGNVCDLRKGISLMDPKPEFEVFVQVLLANQGFTVGPSQILRGKCVEHEVDAIARKDDITYFVEAKHHFYYHTLTGLDETRIARAVLEDVTEGFLLDKTAVKIDRAMIVTNTRYSEHARQYGECRNIWQIGWSSPQNFGLQDMIQEKKLYPLSCLKGLKMIFRRKLVESGIVLIKQLIDEDQIALARKTGIAQDTLKGIIEKAKSAANAFGYSTA